MSHVLSSCSLFILSTEEWPDVWIHHKSTLIHSAADGRWVVSSFWLPWTVVQWTFLSSKITLDSNTGCVSEQLAEPLLKSRGVCWDESLPNNFLQWTQWRCFQLVIDLLSYRFLCALIEFLSRKYEWTLNRNVPSSVQFSRSVLSDSVTPWTAACQASLSITNPRNLLKLMSMSRWCHQPSHPLSSPSPPAFNLS